MPSKSVSRTVGDGVSSRAMVIGTPPTVASMTSVGHAATSCERISMPVMTVPFAWAEGAAPRRLNDLRR